MSITIGEVKGMNDSHMPRVPLGSCATAMPPIRPMMMGMVAKDTSCEASCTLSTADPMAAKMEEYVAEDLGYICH